PSKLVAKIASDLNKPDGLTIVPHGKVHEFLDPLLIQKLWGVGKATQKTLTFMGIMTIGDLRRLDLDILEKKFGRHGTHLYNMSRGWDRREVETRRKVKSIGHEMTFSEDILKMEGAEREILSLSTEVARRMRHNNQTGKTITLKVKYSDFVQITRSITLPKPTQDHGLIFRTSRMLLGGTEVGSRPVRLLGVSLSHLSGLKEQDQASLFPDEDDSEQKQKLNVALDTITDKYGRKAIRPAFLLKK
ncbi:MAG: DNA polymerase IV, partial [Deltaproteobacteria bacterium]|nr:DNA polymerase IV [Deltaproteobacteria bacterium]